MMGPSKKKVEDEFMLTYDHQNTHARWAFTSLQVGLLYNSTYRGL